MAKKAVKKSKKAVKKVVKKVIKKGNTKSRHATKRAPAGKAVQVLTKVKKVVRRALTKVPPAKPRGFAPVSVAPGFTVNDAEASVAWYRDVLGFSVKQRWEHEGQFRGAEMSAGAITLNISQDDWKLGRDRAKGQGVRLYVATGPEIDRFAAQVKAKGGALDHDPQDGWGVRAFSITDPDGYKLTFMTDLKMK